MIDYYSHFLGPVHTYPDSPETKSKKKGLEVSNVQDKNLCILTTAEKPTSVLGQFMYDVFLKTTFSWRLEYVKRSRGQSRNSYPREGVLVTNWRKGPKYHQ